MADGKRTCQFYLLRYVPNIVRGEFVNLGVLLYDPAANRLHPPRLLENFRRVRRLHPWADLDVLTALEKQIEEDTPARGEELPAYLDRLQQFSNLLQALEGVQEGASNILDNTIAVLGSDCSEGYTHGNFDMPVVIAGGGGGVVEQHAQVDELAAHDVGHVAQQVELAGSLAVSHG